MSTADARLSTVVEGLHFGEAPRWHDGRLYLSDIAGGRVLALDRDGKLETIVEFDGRPSGLGWLPDGRLLVVSMLDHRLLRLDDGGLVTAADISAFCGGEANDMVVDARGRAYIGNIGFELHGVPHDQLDIRPTGLVRVDPDGEIHEVASEMMSPNGMALSADGRTLVVAEPAAARLTAFEVDESGDLSGRRVFARFTDGAVPDGICLDAEGCVWMASPTTRAFLRVEAGGRILDRIATGDRVAIACVLGDRERKTLYCVTNARMSIESSTSVATGRIEAVAVAVGGAGRP